MKLPDHKTTIGQIGARIHGSLGPVWPRKKGILREGASNASARGC
jgi:hypothetical protein